MYDYKTNIKAEEPTVFPTSVPSNFPTFETNSPTIIPTIDPSNMPSMITTLNSIEPTMVPSYIPTITPTVIPSNIPTMIPTLDTIAPTMGPSYIPSITPNVIPSNIPTKMPTLVTIAPSVNPSNFPLYKPPLTKIPTMLPTAIEVGNFAGNDSSNNRLLIILAIISSFIVLLLVLGGVILFWCHRRNHVKTKVVNGRKVSMVVAELPTDMNSACVSYEEEEKAIELHSHNTDNEDFIQRNIISHEDMIIINGNETAGGVGWNEEFQ